MYVIDHTQQIRTGFDQECFESTLKNMASFPAEFVEPIREDALQPLHSGGEVRSGALRFSSVWAGNDNIGMKPPTKPFSGLK